jgi:hypothetical protein
MGTRLFAVSDGTAWPITGTLEEVRATNGIQNGEGQVRINSDGEFYFDYDHNGAQVDWDSQVTATDDYGQRIFLDEDSDEWPEDQCMLLVVDDNGEPLLDEDGDFIEADAADGPSDETETADEDLSYAGSVRRL